MSVSVRYRAPCLDFDTAASSTAHLTQAFHHMNSGNLAVRGGGQEVVA
jgi:hypothetical protein